MRAIVFILNLIVLSPLFSQHMGTYSQYVLTSEAFGKSREIKVFKTQAIDEMSHEALPVLYVFDAQFEPYWGMVTQMVNYLSNTGQVSPMIVVGIVTEHRPREFTPAPLDERTRADWEDTPIGDAALLSAHMRDDVIPFVEANYPVNPLRIAIGHSLGGTYVSNSVFSNEGLFHAVVSVSPNSVYDYNWMARQLTATLQSGNVPSAWHYAAVGTVGQMENFFKSGCTMADSIYQSMPQEQLIWTYKSNEGLNHMTSPIVAIQEGLIEFNKFWNLGEDLLMLHLADTTKSFVNHIQDHYKALSQWAGFDIDLSANEINTIGYFAAFEENWEAALGVIQWGLDTHPNDPNLHDSKGECLENLGQLEEALLYYTKAMEVLERVKDQYGVEDQEYFTEIFTLNADRVREALANGE